MRAYYTEETANRVGLLGGRINSTNARAACEGTATRVQARGQLARRRQRTIEGSVIQRANPINRLGRARIACVGGDASDQWGIAADGIGPKDIGRALKENAHSSANAQLSLLGGIPGKAEAGPKVSDTMIGRHAWHDAHGGSCDLPHQR